jgi:hypothetical protein
MWDRCSQQPGDPLSEEEAQIRDSQAGEPTSLIMRQREHGTLVARQPNSTWQRTLERAGCSFLSINFPLLSPQKCPEWVHCMGLEMLDQHSPQTQVTQRGKKTNKGRYTQASQLLILNPTLLAPQILQCLLIWVLIVRIMFFCASFTSVYANLKFLCLLELPYLNHPFETPS